MTEITRQPRPCEIVGDKNEDDPQQHGAHGAARHFQHQQHHGDGGHPVKGQKRIHACPAVDNVLAVHGKPEPQKKTETAQQNIREGNPFGGILRSRCKNRRIAEKGQRQRKGHKQSAQDKRINKTERRAVNFNRSEKQKQNSRNFRP